MAWSQPTVMTPVEIFKREEIACTGRAKEVSPLSLNGRITKCATSRWERLLTLVPI